MTVEKFKASVPFLENIAFFEHDVLITVFFVVFNA